MAKSSESNLGPKALVLMLLAALGIGAPALRASKGQAVAEGAASKIPVAVTQHTLSYRHSAAELLEKFFGTNTPPPFYNKPWSTNDEQSIVDGSISQAELKNEFVISFLIETVPASSSASLRHEFDSYLNAIQMAAGRAGYVLDSFDLPSLDAGNDREGESRPDEPFEGAWEQRNEPDATNSDQGSHGARSGRAKRGDSHQNIMLRPEAKQAPAAIRDPAVLLFRNDGFNKRLLVVFLVDETPTGGINKDAMYDALDQIAWLSGWKNGASSAPQYLMAAAACRGNGGRVGTAGAPCITGDREVRIVGPTFSGSALSLRNSLMQWMGAQRIQLRKISILSGTATAISNRLSIGETNRNPRLEFHSVRIADSAIWEFLRPFLGTPADPEHPAVAVLSDDTSYGGSTTGQSSDILRITFPVHISNLRNAAARADQTLSGPGPGLGRHDIPIADESNRLEKDVIPLLSARSAVYDELELRNLLATLNAQRIRYVGVVATDVEDLVFLVHEIRRACPDTVVFTTSADLRYIHSDVNADLLGMLVFSTYPLFDSNQDWTYPFTGRSQRIQFPGEDAEGVFNATIVQLDHADDMEEYGAPFATGPVSQVRTPALWVGVVGHDAIWPVRFQIESGSENLYTAQTLRTGAPALELVNLYPLPFQIAFLLICLGCLLPAAAMLSPGLFNVIPPSRGAGRSWPEALFGDAVFPEFQRERWMRVSAFLGALLIALVVAFGYFLLPLRSASLFGGVAQTVWLSLPIALATIFAGFLTTPAILAAITAALSRIRARRDAIEQGPELVENLAPTGAQFALFGTIVGLALVTLFVISQWVQPPGFALLNFIRAANLGNGVSPLMPLIFLGTANLCLIGGDLWRLRLIEDCRIKPPFLNFEAAAQSFRGTEALEARVIHLVECSPWELPGTWLLIALIAGAFIYFGCIRGLPFVSIDGWSFNLLFFLSAAFIYFYFSILLLRFVWVWRELHRLLRRLYWHPTRGGYSLLRLRSLPESSEQRIRLIEPRPSLAAMEFCLEHARRILSLLDLPEDKSTDEHGFLGSPQIREDLGDTVRSAEGEIAKVLAAQTRPDWRLATALRTRAEELMARLSGQIAALLEPAWRLVSDRPPPNLAERDQKIIESGNLFVASRVVDFLRHAFPQLRILSGSAMAGLLAMMLAASAYPFVQRDLLLWISWIVLLAAVATGVTIFVQISRSRIVSMLCGTTPGHFNWDSAFTIRILMFGVIPILTLLGAQYPNTLGGIVSWIGRVLGGGPAQ
ncbi:MAG: hypothetical protein JO166_00205 [Deltaproteobacteria bacterium]|nr:hypothetical protein [Deltaproteobacteria bacterium]